MNNDEEHKRDDITWQPALIQIDGSNEMQSASSLNESERVESEEGEVEDFSLVTTTPLETK